MISHLSGMQTHWQRAASRARAATCCSPASLYGAYVLFKLLFLCSRKMRLDDLLFLDSHRQKCSGTDLERSRKISNSCFRLTMDNRKPGFPLVARRLAKNGCLQCLHFSRREAHFNVTQQRDPTSEFACFGQGQDFLVSHPCPLRPCPSSPRGPAGDRRAEPWPCALCPCKMEAGRV